MARTISPKLSFALRFWQSPACVRTSIILHLSMLALALLCLIIQNKTFSELVILLISCTYVSTLFLLSLIDIQTRRLPTVLCRPLFASGFAFSVLFAELAEYSIFEFVASLSWGLFIVLLVCAVPWIVNKKNSKNLLGFGDVRLMLTMAIAIGKDLFAVVFLACIFGIIYSLISKNRIFAFGPCLSFPMAVAIFLKVYQLF